MKKIDQFTNQYPIHKTLRFALQPVGATESFLAERLVVQNDERRADGAERVKEFMDRYYKMFMESILSATELSDLDHYAELFFNAERTEDETQELYDMGDAYRRAIVAAFTENKKAYDKMFGKEMLTELLPSILDDEEEKAIVASFKSFTTFFYAFYSNRKNAFEKDSGHCSVAHRCIEDNLPKFLGNVRLYTQVRELLPASSMKHLADDLSGLFGCEISTAFTPTFFNNVLTQTGIDLYNTVIGGYTTGDGTKVKGLNEYINHYNQTLVNGEKKLPYFKQLYKQILSDRETISFVADQFKTDAEVLAAINDFCASAEAGEMTLDAALDGLKTISTNIRAFDLGGIFVSGKNINKFSSAMIGSWHEFRDAWNREYDANSSVKNKTTKAYAEQKEKAFKRVQSFSLARIQEICKYRDEDKKPVDVAGHVEKQIRDAIFAVCAAHDSAEHLWTEPRDEQKRLANDESAIQYIKEFLDAVKELELVVKLLLGTGKEDGRHAEFYEALEPLCDKLATMDRLYERVRNYVTKKPYSKEKLKLTFDLGDFLSGWAQDFGKKGAHIIRKGGDYYLMVVEKKLTNEDLVTMESGSEENAAIRYGYHFVKPDNKTVPKMLIRSAGTNFAPAIKKHDLPVYDILDLYDNGYFKTECAKKDPELFRASLIKLIDYFKLGFSKHDSLCKFHCQWKPTEEYRTIAEFYADAQRFCYSLSEDAVNLDGLLELVKEGKIYLFRFNNKDFSAHSKGTPNMHTLYFKALFSPENLAAPLFKLDGQAEMFYRKASISDADKIVHPALYPINNKNPDNEKSTSVFEYDIVKDRRFTTNQYFIHIPITMNFGATGSEKEASKKVRAALKNAGETYVIGINRGEKNLVFATVIDGKGNVVEQRSFNVIRGVDYHALLERKENERQQARRDWKTINNIANIKEGYISYVVREICDMVMKYDAVIAMEDLTSNFTSSRAKIEKQVYQKFEKMLVDKLTFLAVKNAAPSEPGGLLRAYQLTGPVSSFDDMRGQNGIIFYVPTWSIGKTDPATGFANLFQTKYTNVKAAKAFFDCFDEIRYNADEDYFEFSFDYSTFNYKVADFTNSWTVCTNGDRVHNFVNPEDGKWQSKNVVLTPAFKDLFATFGVDHSGNMKKAICDRDEKDFFEKLLTLFSLTVQIRNSYIGNVDDDFVISPCKDKNGNFFDSRDYKRVTNATMPASADANDAYNIARKGLWALSVLRDTPDDLLPKVRLSISNKDWLRYAQEQGANR